MQDFEKIRPYHDDEINAAAHRMIQHPLFHAAMQYLFSEEEKNEIVGQLTKVETSLGFQKAVMYKSIQRILERSCENLTVSNEECLLSSGPAVFVSNHRDILLDSAILQYVLVDQGLETSEITFGSNLMMNDFIVDFGKSNRMFTVFRDGSAREMLLNSQRLSAYIKYTLEEKKRSSWIAQRKGRTKNGMDLTDSAVLKMLTTFDRKNPIEAFKKLNIVPVVLSYEYEPCDLLKIREMYLSKDKVYVKEAGEDLQSVLTGITQEKGHIHIAIGKPVNDFIAKNEADLDKLNVHQKVAEYIDRQVYEHYQLHPSNYWAYDQLKESEDYKDKYDLQTAEIMEKRLVKLYQLMNSKDTLLKEMFLQMYANPLILK